MNNKSASLKPYRMGTSGNNEHRLKFRFALNLQPSAKMQMSHLHLICYGVNIWQIFQAMSVERYSMTSMIFKWIVPEKIHPPTEEIINTPSLSLDILYKLFFRQFSSLYGGNSLCGWGMDPFMEWPKREYMCFKLMIKSVQIFTPQQICWNHGAQILCKSDFSSCGSCQRDSWRCIS